MSKKPKKNDTRANIDFKEHLKSVDVGVKDGVFVFTSPLTVGEFAKKINKSTADILKYFFLKGVILNINDVLQVEQIGELCLENNLDFKIEKEINVENVLDNISFDKDSKDNIKRPPVVTIMGHVDHGKTTLLDKIRLSQITSTEAGGITQHIGAYQILKNNNAITFIDTPGHEAFSEMRARGANITDLVVLVVAADDGVKLQTEEAIDHAKAANVPIIVFVNKMDKETANPDKVISQLSERDLICEEWGGDTIFVKGSAFTGDGINELLDAIITLSEVMELKANPNQLAYGTIIEAFLDKGQGPVATILIQNGTLTKGDFLVAGSSFGRVRTIKDENKNILEDASLSKPVIISGLETVPVAGSKFLCVKNEKDAKQLAEKIRQKQIKEENMNRNKLSSVREKIANGELKNLNVIIKADVQGSLEAIKGTISKINIEGATVSIIRSAIGQITESDIRLAQTSEAIIISFNIKANKAISELANNSNVLIYFFDIIYKLKDELENLLKGVLDPIYEEEIIGELEVLQLWHHSSVGTIAGCNVRSGKVSRNAKCRVIRDDVVVYNSEISSLKHNKDQASEVVEGKECGITIKNYNDIKVNDVIEVYKMIEKKFGE